MSIPRPAPDACALVTGASSGIGRELARGLAARGHAVVLVARRRERLEELARELAGRHGVRAEPIACDLVDRPARTALPQRVRELGLRVDVLVNNAGFGVGGPFHESRLDYELQMLGVLCEAPLELTRAFLPSMVARRSGAVLNVASTAGMQPLPHSAGYAAAKAHLLSFSEALHAEVRRHGVSVTALCPGPVDTELFERNDHPVERLPRPLWLQADRVAAEGLHALERNRRVVIPGAIIRAGSPLMRLAPRALELRLVERIFR
ncbi:MAG: Short-chain dehydrogenase/reductase SDR [uncultured Solirubrobacteraceae bacterium]|uniref:Short-chain dehydrogenase/reductase SDR n=1 Tax=uncultured Solirubrobacteraceae bacterium TaxID=1162706 RepID=A0A6J4R2K1_9ACTN|nr:MAG: Short-chain dehydrogenase/reductase SDR [uncultured Solirubrobacteraceae bacterium]